MHDVFVKKMEAIGFSFQIIMHEGHRYLVYQDDDPNVDWAFDSDLMYLDKVDVVHNDVFSSFPFCNILTKSDPRRFSNSAMFLAFAMIHRTTGMTFHLLRYNATDDKYETSKSEFSLDVDSLIGYSKVQRMFWYAFWMIREIHQEQLDNSEKVSHG